MNPPTNRNSQSSTSAKSPASTARQEVETASKTPQPAQDIATSEEKEVATAGSLKVPIPTPSYYRQYRAIGLVRGRFEASDHKITHGVLHTTDGAAIDAVLLGRMISLIKKHLDLGKPHLWVVYPRTRQEDDKLHLQISGVWEPETLHRQEEPGAAANAELEAASPKVESGYFSIRGEVIFYSLEKEIVIVKIRQSPKKEGERPKFFKIKLKGSLPNRPLRNFWDMQVQLQGEILTIVSGSNLGLASKRKSFNQGRKKTWSKQPRKLSESHSASPAKPTTGSPPCFQRPIKKREG